ncbi:DUF4062 domain-containing protein [Fictibacillus gelatini]|uniref:DUF4062 domain-containing protein n=1 Tax=Fictibacillus gelatini TaxID=225985 RepID=UPI00047C87F0
MYEKNFGPWPANQLVEKCLEKVEESDIFILIISYQAGNYSEYYKATVTHLEFQRAYTSGKYTMVFVEDPIYNLFWNELKEQFPEFITKFKEEYGCDPDSYKEIAEKVWESHPKKQVNSHIDSYTWGFLYDLYIKGQYLEKIPFGQSPLPKIKEYLSDLFRQGSQYLRIESVINKQAQMSNIYDKLFQFTNTVLDYIEDGQIINSRLFLAHLQPLMSGGDIFYKKGTVFERIIGQYRNCSGITLYKKEKENDVEMLVLKGVTGAASDENKLYHLNDTTSFVVKTFNSKLDKELFFDASKQQLYFVINVKNYVICFHYPIDPYLSEDMIQRFKPMLIL